MQIVCNCVSLSTLRGNSNYQGIPYLLMIRAFLPQKSNFQVLMKSLLGLIMSKMYLMQHRYANNLFLLVFAMVSLSKNKRSALVGSKTFTIKRLFQTLLWCAQQFRKLDRACIQFSNISTLFKPNSLATLFYYHLYIIIHTSGLTYRKR